jgi:hypothetical protein
VVNGQLEDSLRHEIETYLEGRLSAIKQEIATLQSQMNESLANLLDRQGRNADGRQPLDLNRRASARLLMSGESNLPHQNRHAQRPPATWPSLKRPSPKSMSKKSQADILKALVNRAASFAPRVAFFVIKGNQASGWRGRGFEGSVGDNAVQVFRSP